MEKKKVRCLIFLETDVLFELLNKKSTKGDEIFQKLEKSNESFAITSITFYQIVSFFITSDRQVPPINLLQVYGFSKEDAQKAAELELILQKKDKKEIGTTNLMTAAVVINKGSSLCTLDHRFEELKDLGLKLFLV
jgi:predicted nucleic acid-binding protein